MNWSKLKFLLIDTLIFLARNWTWILGLTIFIVLAWFISTCRQRSFEKKIDRLDSNISEANFEIKVLSNQKDAQENVVNQAAVNSGAAINKANEIRNANFANTKLSEAEKARCLAYPESCK